MTPPATIDSIRLRQVNLTPKVVRTDAIQSFVTQETLLLTLRCNDGVEGTGYAYTIGAGGSIAWDWPEIGKRQLADLTLRKK